jgi:hypothetical protein
LIGLCDALDFLHKSWRDGRLYAQGGDDSARFPAYRRSRVPARALLECLQCRWAAHAGRSARDALLDAEPANTAASSSPHITNACRSGEAVADESVP